MKSKLFAIYRSLTWFFRPLQTETKAQAMLSLEEVVRLAKRAVDGWSDAHLFGGGVG